MYFVYVLRCVDSSLYCGYTTDVAHRIKAHTGKVKGGARYTKIRPPVRVEAVWSCSEKGTALALEKLFKNLDKQDKELLVSDNATLTGLFGDKLESGHINRERSHEGDIREAADGDMESVARLPQDQ